MIGLAVWLVLAAGAIALSTSAALAIGLGLARSLLGRVEPRARARLFALAAFAPLVLASLALGAVLLPHSWLGLPEHCVHHDDDHLHLCLAHGAPLPSAVVILLASALGARWLAALGAELVGAARASRALRRLRAASAGTRSGVTRLPLAGPLAFTAGWLRPQVFASAPIADGDGWQAVIAHELDHAAHRDPLVRLGARLASALHLPGVGIWIVRELEAAQELAADEHAARAVGDRVAVAEQILAFAREAARTPPAAAGFAEGRLAARVAALLDAPRYVRGPSRAHARAALALLGAATAPAATSIHHGLEALLALIGP